MRKHSNLKINIVLGIIFAFLANIFGVDSLWASEGLVLPPPGQMVSLSQPFNPIILKGLKVHTDNPFRIDFILDKGDVESNSHRDDKSNRHPERSEGSQQEQLKTEATKLIKYFLASLTIPEQDLWVNLSPYEKNRIIPDAFGGTQMGSDLLAQDYMLKQITASVIYPEGKIGKEFWAKVYAMAQKKYGKTDVPINTFNKVWIVPEKAIVYENKDSAYVVESRLKVMLEQDYLALGKHGGIQNYPVILSAAKDLNKINSIRDSSTTSQNDNNAVGSQAIKEIVIPILEKEVNEGKNFAQLRQVYNSLILGIWFKDKIKKSLLGKAYVDQNKIGGVDIADKTQKDKIWQQYVMSFKKGVFNYIKDESTFPRKYFSGGADFNQIRKSYEKTNDPGFLPQGYSDRAMIVESNFLPTDRAMNSSDLLRQLISIDGHRNPFVYHTSGNIYTGSVPLKPKIENDKAMTSEYRKNLAIIDAVMEQLLVQVTEFQVAVLKQFSSSRYFSDMWAQQLFGLRSIFNLMKEDDSYDPTIDNWRQIKNTLLIVNWALNILLSRERQGEKSVAIKNLIDLRQTGGKKNPEREKWLNDTVQSFYTEFDQSSDLLKDDFWARAAILRDSFNHQWPEIVRLFNALKPDSIEPIDAAMLNNTIFQPVKSVKNGGIDLAQSRVGLELQREGQSVEFTFDPSMIHRLQNASGLMPVILGIHSLTTSVLAFLK